MTAFVIVWMGFTIYIALGGIEKQLRRIADAITATREKQKHGQ